MSEITAAHVQKAAEIVAIDRAVNVILGHRVPKQGLFRENETYRVLRYLEALKEQIRNS